MCYWLNIAAVLKWLEYLHHEWVNAYVTPRVVNLDLGENFPILPTVSRWFISSLNLVNQLTCRYIPKRALWNESWVLCGNIPSVRLLLCFVKIVRMIKLIHWKVTKKKTNVNAYYITCFLHTFLICYYDTFGVFRRKKKHFLDFFLSLCHASECLALSGCVWMIMQGWSGCKLLKIKLCFVSILFLVIFI